MERGALEFFDVLVVLFYFANANYLDPSHLTTSGPPESRSLLVRVNHLERKVRWWLPGNESANMLEAMMMTAMTMQHMACVRHFPLQICPLTSTVNLRMVCNTFLP